MNLFAVLLAVSCCLAPALARPGFQHGGTEQLIGIPDISSYDKLSYPKLDVLDLGTSIKGSLPPAIVQITQKELVKIPQPYPVKVPHKVPYPVTIPKPYPVVETKIVKVPQPVPYEVIKKIPVPYEVPKPYPVESGSHGAQGASSGYGSGFSGSDIGYHQLSQDEAGLGGGYDVAEGAAGISGGNYESYGDEHGEDDQSAGYQALEQPQDGWTPVSGVGDGQHEQGVQEEQH